MILVEQILPACEWVTQQARHVTLHPEKIPDYAERILKQYPLVTKMDANSHYISADREETAAYILALDSINFGSGYFHLCPGLEYAAIAGGLKKAFERGELNAAAQWVRVTPEYLSRLFSVPQGGDPKLEELLAFLAQHLRETGKNIIAEYQGKVLPLLEQAGYSALKLADIVAVWKSFRDVGVYKGREIPFLKRAQILAADMNLALGGFKDMEALTIFADNMVPHVLRYDGIISYDEGLSLNVDCGMLIVAGSEEEVEIRAAAVYAVELMKQAAHRQGHNVTSVNLDHLLWQRGYEPELYKKPRHRTLTVSY